MTITIVVALWPSLVGSSSRNSKAYLRVIFEALLCCQTVIGKISGLYKVSSAELELRDGEEETWI